MGPHSCWESQRTQSPSFPVWGQDALGFVALEVLHTHTWLLAGEGGNRAGKLLFDLSGSVSW